MPSTDVGGLKEFSLVEGHGCTSADARLQLCEMVAVTSMCLAGTRGLARRGRRGETSQTSIRGLIGKDKRQTIYLPSVHTWHTREDAVMASKAARDVVRWADGENERAPLAPDD